MKKIIQIIKKTSEEKGWKYPDDCWEREDFIPAKIMLFVTELSEAVEAFRKRDRENFVEEMADNIIRTIDMCNNLNMDIEKAIKQKIEKNKKRSFRHGGKRI